MYVGGIRCRYCHKERSQRQHALSESATEKVELVFCVDLGGTYLADNCVHADRGTDGLDLKNWKSV